MIEQIKPSKYVNLTASALVKTGPGVLVGMYVNSTSAGTIQFEDAVTDTTPVITGTITPAVGFHNLGNLAFTTGLYAKIGATLNVTLLYI